MNFFNLFGTKKEDNRNKVIETIHMLTDTISTQEKRKTHLEKLVDQMKKEAQDYVRVGKKDSALASLKKKKMYEKQITMIDSTMFNLEAQKINLENSQIQKSAIDSLSRVNSVMKDSTMNADKVEKIMDDLQDAVDQQQEISDALTRPLVNIDVDDELKELEELNEFKPNDILILNLPNVPVRKEVTKDVTEVEELKKQLDLL